MVISTIGFNPLITTNAAGTFNATSEGFITGTAMADPAVRNQLVGGWLSASETLPMVGGVGIYENVPGISTNPVDNLGPQVGRATSISNLLGFSVFDQAHAMIMSAQSPVPQSLSYGLVNYYRLGSLARIPLPILPSLAASIEGGLTNQQVSWDFVNQMIIPYEATFANTTITGATWASTSGGQANYTVSTDLTASLAAGDQIVVTGVVSTGGTGAGYNGTWIVVSVTSTHVVVTLPAASSVGTYSSGGTITGGGGALPVKIIDVNVGNSMAPVWNASTGFYTWNRSASAAVVVI